MSLICEHCGRSNREAAKFCLGCARPLPGFVSTGPSALATMQSLRGNLPAEAPPAPAAPRAERPATPALAHPRTWWQLLALGGMMTAAFTGWYSYVTRKVDAPLPPAALAAASNPLPAPVRSPSPALLAPPPSTSLPPPLAPLPSVPVRAAVAEPAAPATAPVAVVASFYRALSAGNGKAAAAVVTPGKRGVGAYDEDGLTKFYGSFREPLSVQSIKLVGANTVEARYRYRATRTPCEGTAIVETETVRERTYVRRIRANC